jgi:hypothetical protein
MALAVLALLQLNSQLSVAHAQNTLVNYQGRVLDSGTNFTGAGQFQFALVTSANANSQATATAHAPSGGFITIINVKTGGSGYVTAPTVTIFGGGGSGATATANLTAGVVTSITVNSPGSNYTSAPIITIAPPPPDISYTTYWSNDGTSSAGSEPTASVGIAVNDGLFTVVLGDTTIPNMQAINAALFNQPDLQLRIWFNDGVNGFAALDPVQNLNPSPYSVFANTASNVSGTVSSANFSGTYANAVTLNNAGNSFAGNGGGLTNLNATRLASGTVADARLSANVAMLDANQTFTGIDTFTGSNQSLIIDGGAIGTNLFNGLGFQYNHGTGEGAIISSLDDGAANLTFYTKPGAGYPIAKQMKIDRYGVVMVDQQNVNNGVLNDGTTNGVGLAFGANSGEGIASQRTPGANQHGLDFYTAHNHRLSILNNGNIGIGTTNPGTALQVNGVVTATTFSGDAGGLTNLNATQLTGTVPLTQLPGAVVTNNNAAELNGLRATNFWQLGGNATTSAGADFLGTTDKQPLEFHVNGLRVLRLEPVGASAVSGTNTPTGAPNLIGGSPINFVASGVVGAVIAGGGATNYYGNTYGGAPFRTAYSNFIAALSDFSTIGGGAENSVATNSFAATVSGGFDNIATGEAATVGGGGGYYGGDGNQASGGWATVGGGFNNIASGYLSTISGGGGFLEGNRAYGDSSTVGGGYYNVAGNDESTVGGGYDNYATNISATVPGGQYNVAAGEASFAAGSQAQALHDGAFVWADSQNAAFSSTGNNQFLIRAQGGVGINTSSPQQALSIVGGLNIDQGNTNGGSAYSNALTFGYASGEGIASKRFGPNQFDLEFYTSFNNRLTILNNGDVGVGTISPVHLFQVGNAVSPAYCDGSVWQNASDRNAKKNFAAIDPRTVLEKVSALPIAQWQYKAATDGTEHVGPMAQDFHAAFGLNGSDDTHIATVDEEGVALAAIQGLNQKLETDSKCKDAEIAALERSVAELKQMVQNLAASK